MPDVWFPHLGIEIDHINRVAFSIFGLEIAWYGLIIALGVAGGLGLACLIAKKTGQKTETYTDFIIYALIFSILGARIYYVIFSWEYYAANPLQIFNVRGGGMAIYGAVIAAVCTALIYCKVKKYDTWLLIDTAIPGLALGQAIGQPCLTAIDDGTLDGVWGSLKFDDEGMPTQRTVLIENGILKSYMSDRVGAAEVGVVRTGSARRESYKYAPVSRMRNTFIAPGNDSFDSMIESMDYGLYAARMAGGSVNPATGEFNFAVDEGYVVRNGKICEPVRGATLIGKGHEIMPRISMVGSDLELATGICGASSGHVPVTVGQPTIKVDQILVGGR